MEEKWYKLDNAAQIYPAVREKEWSSIFRLDAIMKNEVNANLLQTALHMTYKRFPTFSVQISKGFFWNYFEPNESEPQIMPETSYPIRPFSDKSDNGYLYRVLYYKKRISLEVFHSISDGYGATVFFKTLLLNYITLLDGKEPVADSMDLCKYGILHHKDMSTYEETEDAFQRYSLKNKKLELGEKTAYKIPGTRIYDNSLRITHILLSVKSLHKLAKVYSSSITQFLTSLFIHSIFAIQTYFDMKPVKISVPINLRSRFPSKTLRNFSSYVNVEIFGGENGEKPELRDICISVGNQIRAGTGIEQLRKKFSSNVTAGKKLIMRGAPLVIKNVALKIAFSLYGERIITSTLSNIGSIELPEKMADLIERFDVLPGAPRQNAFNCGVTSFQDLMSITFIGIISENMLLKAFVDFLVANQIDVSIETNY